MKKRQFQEGGPYRKQTDAEKQDVQQRFQKRAAEEVSTREKRMRESGEAEQGERQLAKGMTGSEKSARADVWHNMMMEDARSALDLRRKLAESAAKRFQFGGYQEPQLTRPAGSVSPGLPAGTALAPEAPMPGIKMPKMGPINQDRMPEAPDEEEETDPKVAAVKKKIKGLQGGQEGMFSHITSPWKRALLAGGLGAGMSAGAGGWGALAGGAGAAILAHALNRKKKPTEPVGAIKNATGGSISEGGSMQMSKGRAPGRRLRFQIGGGVPPIAGSLPPGLPPGGPPGLAGGPPPGLPPGGPPGLAGPPPLPPVAPAGPPPPPVGPIPPPGLASIAGGGPGFPGGPPVPPGVPAPLPQVAAPGAAAGVGLPPAGLGPRPGRMRKGGAVKAKGKGVLTRRPKISIAIVNKKSPIPTPSPYDIDAPEPPPIGKANGGKIAAKAKGGKIVMRKRHGGKCDDVKMAAGGVAKVRKGFPNVNATPKKLASGGKVRGCGAATKGTSFSGIF